MDKLDADSAIYGSVMSIQSTVDNTASTTDKTASNTTLKQSERAVVDKGYSWVVMMAVFFTLTFTSTISSVNTLLYQVYLVKFQLNATTAGWIVSLPGSLRFLSSPLVGPLYQRFSVRTLAMVGSVAHSLGFLMIAFGNEVWVLYVASVVMGVGSNMYIMSCFIIIPQYFVKKRGIAMGFALCGFSVGGMVSAPLVTWSFEYFGITQTLIFMAGVLLQMFVTTALFRPQVTPAKSISNCTETAAKSKLQVVKDRYGLGLLGRPVLVYLIIVIASLHCILVLNQIFISGLAIEIMNMTPHQLATMISTSAFFGFFKMPVGFLFDRPSLRPYCMYIWCVACIVTALVQCTVTFTSTPLAMTVCYSTYVACGSVSHSQYSNMLADMVGLKDLPNLIALNRTIVGISLFLVPIFMGRIKDLLDSFKLGFLVMDIVLVSLVIGYIVAYACWRKHKSSEPEPVKI